MPWWTDLTLRLCMCVRKSKLSHRLSSKQTCGQRGIRNKASSTKQLTPLHNTNIRECIGARLQFQTQSPSTQSRDTEADDSLSDSVIHKDKLCLVSRPRRASASHVTRISEEA